MVEMEVMLDQLRAAPLEKVGLAEALKKQCEALDLRTGAIVSCEVGELPAATRLAPGAYQAIFRVAQEALANVARHARASHVRVTLTATDNQVQLVVEDDGAGFNADATPRGMGVMNMRERAEEFGGDLVIHSTPGAGTTVTLALPCLPVELAIPNYRLQAKIWTVMLFIQVALGALNPDILVLALVPAGFLARALGRLRQERRETQR
jgi:signal transduction histidine kinase